MLATLTSFLSIPPPRREIWGRCGYGLPASFGLPKTKAVIILETVRQATIQSPIDPKVEYPAKMVSFLVTQGRMFLRLTTISTSKPLLLTLVFW